MSQRVSKDTLTKKQLVEYKDKCVVTGNPTEYGPPESVMSWIETKQNIYVPFHFSKNITGVSPNKTIIHHKSNYDMTTDFKNDMQKEVFNETCELLKKQKSAIVSLFCGGGKCLARDTEIRMYDKSVKKVQDIQEGDLLLGDDDTPRKVLSTTSGVEKMYRIKQSLGEDYVVNESHILTFIIPKHGTYEYFYNHQGRIQGICVYWFDTDKYEMHIERIYRQICDTIQSLIKMAHRFIDKIKISNIYDIPLLNYIDMSPADKSYLYAWRPPMDTLYINNEIPPMDPYLTGLWLMCGNVTKNGLYLQVPHKKIQDYVNTYTKIGPYLPTEYNVYLLKSNAFLRTNLPTNFLQQTMYWRITLLTGILDGGGISCYNHYKIPKHYSDIDQEILELAYSIGFDGIVSYDTIDIYPHIPLSTISPNLYIDNLQQFQNKLTIEPLDIDTYYGFTINGNHRFRLRDFTVTHNTYTGIRLAQKSGYKTAVLVHRVILIEQWKESIEKFTTAKCQIVKTNDVLNPDADFYIMNISYVFKKWNKDIKQWKLKPLGIYKSIGTVIVDEAHVACASEMVKSLFFFEPRVLIGLTATPHRKDGLDRILDLYFGKERIVRISQSKFHVYIFKTFFYPDNVKNAQGKKDWSKVISSITENTTRNNKITKIIDFFPNEHIIILTKRIKHCEDLFHMLQENNISVTKMCGNDNIYDKKARVLISTFSKLGVGFDDTRFNMLILACDVEQVEQYAGRLRPGGRDRIIIDMLDEDSNCKKHLRTRKKWYQSRNGIVEPFEKRFPTFFASNTAIKEDNHTHYKRLVRKK